MNATWKNVTPAVCATWITYLRSAVARKSNMVIFYPEDVKCATLPTYVNAPAPGYIMLQDQAVFHAPDGVIAAPWRSLTLIAENTIVGRSLKVNIWAKIEQILTQATGSVDGGKKEYWLFTARW